MSDRDEAHGLVVVNIERLPAGRPCRACRQIIHFIPGPNGRKIPAQRLSTLYRLEGGVLVEMGGRLYDKATSIVFVSHFETCPGADRFSGKGRRALRP